MALRERVKELNCLYTISQLRELHAHSAERFLQCVAACLPPSFQFADRACARITYLGRAYASDAFGESRWRIGAPFQVQGRPAGVVEVFYRTVPGSAAAAPFFREEQAMINAVAERVGDVLAHIKSEEALREAHEALQREHQALQETNIALRTVLSRLEEEKQEIRASILANIQRLLMPLVFELELEVTGRQRSYVTLLRQNLQEIASPFLTQLCQAFVELTPVEVAISSMIRNGLSTKEIAQLRGISAATVRRHRENIRRKLELTNRKVNLTTFLQSATAHPPTKDRPAAWSRPAEAHGSSDGRSGKAVRLP